MSIFGPTAGELTSAKHRLLDLVRDTSADLAVISYSGGNDEGGADGVRLYKGVFSFDEDTGITTATYEGMNQLEFDDPEPWLETDDNYGRNPRSIVAAADELLSGEFGTWAGEFSAYGNIYVTPATGKVWRDGTYETYSGEGSGQVY